MKWILTFVIIYTWAGAYAQMVPKHKALINSDTTLVYQRQADTAEPLYIIDGEVQENLNKLNKLKADDIEAMNVLKEPKYTSKYGEKGKNGVVEIYTLTFIARKNKEKVSKLSAPFRQYIATHADKKIIYVLNGKTLKDGLDVYQTPADQIKQVEFKPSEDLPTVKITTKP